MRLLSPRMKFRQGRIDLCFQFQALLLRQSGQQIPYNQKRGCRREGFNANLQCTGLHLRMVQQIVDHVRQSLRIDTNTFRHLWCHIRSQAITSAKPMIAARGVLIS